MRKSPVIIFSALLFFGLSFFCQFNTQRHFAYPLPFLFEVKTSSFLHFWGSIIGLRRLSSDLAWMRLLQYYGTHEEGRLHTHDEGHCERGEYKKLLPMCQEVVRLDPYFHYAYLFGGGCLAFNHGRYSEAIELLQEGIKSDPRFWRFRLYIAAIVYTKTKEYDKAIPLLEEAAKYSDCPDVVKLFLANIFKIKGEYAKAMLIWTDLIARSRNAAMRQLAEKHLKEIEAYR